MIKSYKKLPLYIISLIMYFMLAMPAWPFDVDAPPIPSYQKIPQFNKNKMARLSGDWNRWNMFSWDQVLISRLNQRWLNKNEVDKAIFVRPGVYLILVNANFNYHFWKGPFYAMIQIPVDLKAQKDYVVKMEVKGEKIHAWVAENGVPITKKYSAFYQLYRKDSPQDKPMNIELMKKTKQ